METYEEWMIRKYSRPSSDNTDMPCGVVDYWLIDKYGTSEGASLGHQTQGHNAEGGGGGGGPKRYPSGAKEGNTGSYAQASKDAKDRFDAYKMEKPGGSGLDALIADASDRKDSPEHRQRALLDAHNEAIDSISEKEKGLEIMERDRDAMLSMKVSAALENGEYDQDIGAVKNSIAQAKSALSTMGNKPSVKGLKSVDSALKSAPIVSGEKILSVYAKNGYSWANRNYSRR